MLTAHSSRNLQDQPPKIQTVIFLLLFNDSIKLSKNHKKSEIDSIFIDQKLWLNNMKMKNSSSYSSTQLYINCSSEN